MSLTTLTIAEAVGDTRIKFLTCHNCKDQFAVPKCSTHRLVCGACEVLWLHARSRAAQAVNKEIKAGRLKPVRQCRCVDCGEPAVAYEHRSYDAPLAVDPVCRKCNFRRGPAAPLEIPHRPAQSTPPSVSAQSPTEDTEVSACPR